MKRVYDGKRATLPIRSRPIRWDQVLDIDAEGLEPGQVVRAPDVRLAAFTRGARGAFLTCSTVPKELWLGLPQHWTSMLVVAEGTDALDIIRLWREGCSSWPGIERRLEKAPSPCGATRTSGPPRSQVSVAPGTWSPVGVSYQHHSFRTFSL